MIDEFLAKARMQRCADFQETMETFGKVGLKMFLGVGADVTNWSADKMSCSLQLGENPLTDFVELPPSASELCYANLLCGVVRGALEMIQKRVRCTFVRDTLKGDPVNEIRVELLEVMEDVAGDEYKEG